jgi:uncharacterized MnhB-related membrane protein
MIKDLFEKLLAFALTKAVANSERLRTLLVSGALSLLALFNLPAGLAEPIAQAIAAVGLWLATLYTLRKPGAPSIQLPPPPDDATGVPGA